MNTTDTLIANEVLDASPFPVALPLPAPKHHRDIYPMSRAERRSKRLHTGQTMYKYPVERPDGGLDICHAVVGDCSYLRGRPVERVSSVPGNSFRPSVPMPTISYLLASLMVKIGAVSFKQDELANA